jgi:peptidoglycan/LPS O-acetylase OafA/YrhL
LNYNIERDIRIDILRALAILCIILAHTAPPDIIFKLRNFDVTMMAFLMGASFYLSNREHSSVKYLPYIKKRFNRLILPAWQFLICFFLLFLFISLVFKETFYFTIEDIIKSFAMIQGVTYMWILAVFFMVALINPLLLFISNKVESNGRYFLLLVGFYLVYSVIIQINEIITNEQAQELFQNFIVNGMGYTLVAAIGIRLYQLTKSNLLIITGILLLLFVSLMFYYDFDPIQAFKYPPTIYYFSYGLFVSLLCFYLLSFDKVKEVFYSKVTLWLSTNSLLLYYYHIIPIYLLKFQGDRLPNWIDLNFITRFIFLFGFAIMMVLIHMVVKNNITKSSTH